MGYRRGEGMVTAFDGQSYDSPVCGVHRRLIVYKIWPSWTRWSDCTAQWPGSVGRITGADSAPSMR